VVFIFVRSGGKMNDHEFLQAFEAATLTAFPHRSHVRMAWLYMRRDGWEAGLQHIREGIQHFAVALGATTKYHETITCFWAHMVYAAVTETPAEDDYEQFVAAHPELLNVRLISEYYSPARLGSDAARRTWVDPDLKPLPVHKAPE
jgi:hypothetical protein